LTTVPGVPDDNTARAAQYERLGITPTKDSGERLADGRPWDEASRPHRESSGAEVSYTDAGRATGQHLIDVHDMLRRELDELRGILTQVRDGAISAGEARSALNTMALRQNDWTLGAFCARYCFAVASHHGLEDEAVFPHLIRAEPDLAPVIERLGAEHLVIHDAIEAVDGALVHHMGHPGDFTGLQRAIDLLGDALLSHLSYEEQELVEPLARLGFYAEQL
jgi:Hemerythrin HHE cation binding domain